jgi:hypothetical protein
MPRRTDEDDNQLPSDPDYITPPTDRRKCGAERVSFSGEGSISVPSPVMQIHFEKQGRAQEQSALCASHLTGISYRPALRYPTSNSIPSPVKRIQAPQSQVISDDDDDYEWKVIAEYATNHEQAMDVHEIVDDIYTHAENFMHASGTVMQPDSVGKQEDLYLWCLIGETKTLRQYECLMRYSCGCDTGIRITETKQSETIGVHDQHSHIGGRMHARKSAPGVGGVSRPESKASANDESGGCSSNQFSSFIHLTLP